MSKKAKPFEPYAMCSFVGCTWPIHCFMLGGSLCKTHAAASGMLTVR